MKQSENKHTQESYIDNYLLLSRSIEQKLLCLIVILVILLFAVQALLRIEGVREHLTGVDRLEGQNVSGFAPQGDPMVY